MQLNNLVGNLEELVAMVQQDPQLDDDFKDEFVDLVAQVADTPTPGNLRALAEVIEKVADAEKYLNALEVVQGAPGA